jgi:hypothetical protein
MFKAIINRLIRATKPQYSIISYIISLNEINLQKDLVITAISRKRLFSKNDFSVCCKWFVKVKNRSGFPRKLDVADWEDLVSLLSVSDKQLLLK